MSKGYSLCLQKYAKHIKQDIYELNPLHQETIHQGRLIKRKTWYAWDFFIILTTFMSGLYLTINYGEPDSYLTEIPDAIPEIILGVFFWKYIEILTNHLKNTRLILEGTRMLSFFLLAYEIFLTWRFLILPLLSIRLFTI
ncbi:MAG: hypothetical protein ACFFB5_23130 [Promethearchaeota archaeon]